VIVSKDFLTVGASFLRGKMANVTTDFRAHFSRQFYPTASGLFWQVFFRRLHEIGFASFAAKAVGLAFVFGPWSGLFYRYGKTGEVVIVSAHVARRDATRFSLRRRRGSGAPDQKGKHGSTNTQSN
jgi:hypothetical protein